MEQAKRRGEAVVAPVILLAEVASGLSRGLDDTALADGVVSLLQSTNLVRLFPVTEALAARAASIASSRRIHGCDAIYVALADQLGEPLVSLDHQQLTRAAGLVELMSASRRRP
jgi:predicted nucleic acid-binding protein